MSMLIDWNIKYDIYASLCVVKHCFCCENKGQCPLCWTVSQCWYSWRSVKPLPPSRGGVGAVLPKYMDGWLVGDGHSWLSSPWTTKDASFTFVSCIWVGLHLALFERFYRFLFLLMWSPWPPLGRVLPFSDCLCDCLCVTGHTDNHSLVCQQLTRWTNAK